MRARSLDSMAASRRPISTEGVALKPLPPDRGDVDAVPSPDPPRGAAAGTIVDGEVRVAAPRASEDEAPSASRATSAPPRARAPMNTGAMRPAPRHHCGESDMGGDYSRMDEVRQPKER